MKCLDVRIDNLDTQQITDEFLNILSQNKLHHIATVNPEFLVEAHTNEKFKNILNSTQLNICDGFGITFWTKILYKKKIHRLPGVELADLICQIAEREQKSIYFLGGFDVAKQAASVQKTKYPALIIAGAEDGKTDELSKKIIQSKPDIIFVAFGAPKQEYWISEFAKQLPNTKLAIGLGGTFDFWTGKVKRAPIWMQKVGLEWLFRLCKDPRTRGKRIWRATVVFSYLMIKEKIINLSD